MKKYELFCAVKGDLDIESVEQVIRNIEETIKNFGGSVLNIDKIGRKRLAFEIEDSKDGFFTAFEMLLPESKILGLRKYLKLNEHVIRELITIPKKVSAVCK